MVQLITFLLVTAALVVLVLQNLSLTLPLVVLGRETTALPLSLWLLIAIAIGSLCTLVIYQLVPQKRTYRPIGQRLSDPPTSSPPPESRFQSPRNDSPPQQNPYDSDWDNFRAPEQWEDWGDRQPTGNGPDRSSRETSQSRNIPRDPYTDPYQNNVGETVRDIESGWGDDEYGWEPSARPPETAPDRDRNSPRTYDEGWLYGSEPADEVAPPAPEKSDPDEPDDVYDANYRVIIPPYDAKET